MTHEINPPYYAPYSFLVTNWVNDSESDPTVVHGFNVTTYGPNGNISVCPAPSVVCVVWIAGVFPWNMLTGGCLYGPGCGVTLGAAILGGTEPYTYSWSFGDGTPASTQATPLHEYAGPGQYTVSLTVTDSQKNQATSQFTLTIA